MCTQVFTILMLRQFKTLTYLSFELSLCLNLSQKLDALRRYKWIFYVFESPEKSF